MVETDSAPNYDRDVSNPYFAYVQASDVKQHKDYVRVPVKNIQPPPPSSRTSPTLWKYPEYVYYGERLASFKDWPKYLRGPSKRDLARAGFVYTKIGDKVTCFWCGMTFKNWEPFDNADKEHLKWSKDCLFAKIISDGC
ncbi:hypothetical protein FSP39_014181 [Pinctada imbricata]|uniref:Uncharacterized protein n=1 Tax=Pinctada imbricata TaxID=66713 RepID=A0AA89CAW5_PINIB|nr:hypothetical protein FSP39_014181 [Pinctada imbricata]